MRRVTAITGVVVVSLVAAVVFVLARSADHSGAADGADVQAYGDGDELQALPHCGGVKVSLATALSEAAYTLTLPEETLASADSVSGVWDCPSDTTVIEFSTGPTDVVWDGWRNDHKLPSPLFQR